MPEKRPAAAILGGRAGLRQSPPATARGNRGGESGGARAGGPPVSPERRTTRGLALLFTFKLQDGMFLSSLYLHRERALPSTVGWDSRVDRLDLDHDICRRFETGGSLSRRVSVLRAPAQMGRARGRARRGERRGGRSQA
jgi:hypothetical protein